MALNPEYFISKIEGNTPKLPANAAVGTALPCCYMVTVALATAIPQGLRELGPAWSGVYAAVGNWRLMAKCYWVWYADRIDRLGPRARMSAMLARVIVEAINTRLLP